MRTHDTDYHDVTTGFYVIPRLQGQRVTLQISAQKQRPMGYRIDSTSVTTEVTGQLGQWIPLGSANESARREQSTLFSTGDARNTDLRNISIRVTIAD